MVPTQWKQEYSKVLVQLRACLLAPACPACSLTISHVKLHETIADTCMDKRMITGMVCAIGESLEISWECMTIKGVTVYCANFL